MFFLAWEEEDWNMSIDRFVLFFDGILDLTSLRLSQFLQRYFCGAPLETERR